MSNAIAGTPSFSAPLQGEVRHIAQGRNVPMYKTNIQTVKAGPFEGPMVCSMRPMSPENAKKAYDITVKMPNVHGAPVHMGDPAEVGVADAMTPRLLSMYCAPSAWWVSSTAGQETSFCR